MTETPREYKKRIDEKRVKNEENKGKLLEKIEGYELLDEKYKAKTKQEILENFEKNEKADKESEQYKTIVTELNSVDKKYEELEILKQTLLSKEKEMAEVEKEIRESKLDGTDETTLKIQMAKVRELKEKMKTLKSEIEELKNEVANREQEIKEIEETYGEILEIDNKKDDKKSEHNNGSSSSDENVTLGKPKTLKEFGEITTKDLRKKDRTRVEIIRLLEGGTGIDDDLKAKIEKEISDKFFDYYDEKQGSLRMKSARFMKNKIRDVKKKYEKADGNDNSELPYVREEFEKLAKIYGCQTLGEIEGNKILESSRKKLQRNYSYENIAHLTGLVEQMSVKTRLEKDGSRLIEFILDGKKYKILDINLLNHSNPEYQSFCDCPFGKGECRSGIRFMNVDGREDEKLKQYVKKKQLEGFSIPSENVIEKLFRKLGNISPYCYGNTIFRYLTGIYGEYWIDKVDGNGDRRYVCTNGGDSNIDWRGQGEARGLFMIASENDS